MVWPTETAFHLSGKGGTIRLHNMMRVLLLSLTVCVAGAQQYTRGERPRMVVEGFNTGEVVER
jgi:hypothetical protein